MSNHSFDLDTFQHGQSLGQVLNPNRQLGLSLVMLLTVVPLFGIAIGWIGGETYGTINGYNRGFAEGFAEGNLTGYAQGFDIGYDLGYIDGTNDLPPISADDISDAYSSGVAFGYAQGYIDGYDDGVSLGYTTGYVDGYNTGILAGSSSRISVFNVTIPATYPVGVTAATYFFFFGVINQTTTWLSNHGIDDPRVSNILLDAFTVNSSTTTNKVFRYPLNDSFSIYISSVYITLSDGTTRSLTDDANHIALDCGEMYNLTLLIDPNAGNPDEYYVRLQYTNQTKIDQYGNSLILDWADTQTHSALTNITWDNAINRLDSTEMQPANLAGVAYSFNVEQSGYLKSFYVRARILASNNLKVRLFSSILIGTTIYPHELISEVGTIAGSSTSYLVYSLLSLNLLLTPNMTYSRKFFIILEPPTGNLSSRISTRTDINTGDLTTVYTNVKYTTPSHVDYITKASCVLLASDPCVNMTFRPY